jgi:hypothetical protein
LNILIVTLYHLRPSWYLLPHLQQNIARTLPDYASKCFEVPEGPFGIFGCPSPPLRLIFLGNLLRLNSVQTVNTYQLAIHIGGSHRVLVPSSHSHPTPDRPLILYAYSESPFARRNIEFFIAHGLHDAADFVFIFNGLTDASALLPDRPNIQHVQRNNTCYDLGAHAEVLIKDGLWKRYTRFILMNSSIRGPFIPYVSIFFAFKLSS